MSSTELFPKTNNGEAHGKDSPSSIHNSYTRNSVPLLTSKKKVGKQIECESVFRLLRGQMSFLKKCFTHFTTAFCLSIEMNFSLSSGDIASAEQSPTPHSAPRMQYLSRISCRFLKIPHNMMALPMRP